MKQKVQWNFIIFVKAVQNWLNDQTTNDFENETQFWEKCLSMKILIEKLQLAILENS